jgi:hypothetical protein
MKAFINILKWSFLGILGILLVGFLYIYFIFLAKPDGISTISQIKDNKWHTVSLGGETICSDGSEYHIFTRQGKSDNLIIHFSGGGACWDDPTCSAPITLKTIFIDGIPKDLKAFYFPNVLKVFPALLSGIFDVNNKDNAFRDWDVIFIPYTTGDLHIGNVTNTYELNGKQIKVHHNGRKNVLAALKWIKANYKNPKKLLVSGESAGAFAAAFWTPYIGSVYDNNKIYQLSDGAYIDSKRWPEIVDTVWKAESASFLKFNIGTNVFENVLLNRQDSLSKRIKYLHCNTLYDLILPKFTAVLNHQSTATNAYIDEWSVGMLGTMKRLSSSNLDYHYFITDCQYDAEKHATPHTLVGTPAYHTCSSDQITFAQWLQKNVIDDKPLSVGRTFLDALK